MHETWASWNALRKYGLTFILVSLIETEVRRMSEEWKLADSGTVIEGAADGSTKERRLKTALWIF